MTKEIANKVLEAWFNKHKEKLKDAKSFDEVGDIIFAEPFDWVEYGEILKAIYAKYDLDEQSVLNNNKR